MQQGRMYTGTQGRRARAPTSMEDTPPMFTPSMGALCPHSVSLAVPTPQETRPLCCWRCFAVWVLDKDFWDVPLNRVAPQ